MTTPTTERDVVERLLKLEADLGRIVEANVELREDEIAASIRDLGKEGE